MPLIVINIKHQFQHRYSPPSRTDGIRAGPEDSEDLLREKFWLRPMIRLGGAVGSAPVRGGGDPASNPGPG